MQELEMFTPKMLRSTLQTLSPFKGQNVEDCVAAIEKYLSGSDAFRGVVCPSCGRGPLRLLSSLEGLNRRGCVLCKYSEVV